MAGESPDRILASGGILGGFQISPSAQLLTGSVGLILGTGAQQKKCAPPEQHDLLHVARVCVKSRAGAPRRVARDVLSLQIQPVIPRD